MLAPPVARSTKTENSDFLSVMKIPRLSWKIVWNNISVPKIEFFLKFLKSLSEKLLSIFIKLEKNHCSNATIIWPFAYLQGLLTSKENVQLDNL